MAPLDLLWQQARPAFQQTRTWQRTLPDQRHTTGRLIGLLRGELWGRALGVNIDGFAAQRDLTMNALKSRNNAAAAVIYSHR